MIKDIIDITQHSPQVSVIVPVYKVEKYIKKCIESILGQTTANFELILVDDGSPDRCGDICDEYAKKDMRVRVIHKENGGVSSARNIGIDEAKGDWITFVDADDAILPDTISKCSQFFDKADVVRFAAKYIYTEDGSSSTESIPCEMSREEYLSKIISRETVLSVWGGFYRTSIFKENDIRFNTSLINGEDWVVLFKTIQKANLIKFISTPLYIYSKFNEKSATYAYNYIYAKSTLDAFSCIESFLKESASLGRYNYELANTKSKLIYSFVAHALLADMKREEYESYISSGGSISIKEIKMSKIKGKPLLLLLLFTCPIFRFFVKLRLNN